MNIMNILFSRINMMIEESSSDKGQSNEGLVHAGVSSELRGINMEELFDMRNLFSNRNDNNIILPNQIEEICNFLCGNEIKGLFDELNQGSDMGTEKLRNIFNKEKNKGILNEGILKHLLYNSIALLKTLNINVNAPELQKILVRYILRIGNKSEGTIVEEVKAFCHNYLNIKEKKQQLLFTYHDLFIVIFLFYNYEIDDPCIMFFAESLRNRLRFLNVSENDKKCKNNYLDFLHKKLCISNSIDLINLESILSKFKSDATYTLLSGYNESSVDNVIEYEHNSINNDEFKKMFIKEIKEASDIYNIEKFIFKSKFSSFDKCLQSLLLYCLEIQEHLGLETKEKKEPENGSNEDGEGHQKLKEDGSKKVVIGGKQGRSGEEKTLQNLNGEGSNEENKVEKIEEKLDIEEVKKLIEKFKEVVRELLFVYKEEHEEKSCVHEYKELLQQLNLKLNGLLVQYLKKLYLKLEKAKQEVEKAKQEVEEVKQEAEKAKQEVEEVKQEAEKAEQEVEEVNQGEVVDSQKIAFANKKLKEATKKVEEANQKLKEVTKKLESANQEAEVIGQFLSKSQEQHKSIFEELKKCIDSTCQYAKHFNDKDKCKEKLYNLLCQSTSKCYAVIQKSIIVKDKLHVSFGYYDSGSFVFTDPTIFEKSKAEDGESSDTFEKRGVVYKFIQLESEEQPQAQVVEDGQEEQGGEKPERGRQLVKNRKGSAAAEEKSVIDKLYCKDGVLSYELFGVELNHDIKAHFIIKGNTVTMKFFNIVNFDNFCDVKNKVLKTLKVEESDIYFEEETLEKINNSKTLALSLRFSLPVDYFKCNDGIQKFMFSLLSGLGVNENCLIEVVSNPLSKKEIFFGILFFALICLFIYSLMSEDEEEELDIEEEIDSEEDEDSEEDAQMMVEKKELETSTGSDVQLEA